MLGRTTMVFGRSTLVLGRSPALTAVHLQIFFLPQNLQNFQWHKALPALGYFLKTCSCSLLAFQPAGRVPNLPLPVPPPSCPITGRFSQAVWGVHVGQHLVHCAASLQQKDCIFRSLQAPCQTCSTQFRYSPVFSFSHLESLLVLFMLSLSS